jgi:hypothetical protein
MKLRLLMCTVLLALFAVPAFADSVSFTNRGGGLSLSSSGVSANSMINTLSLDGTQILSGNVGTLQFDTGNFVGSLLSGGTFTGGDFSFALTGSTGVVFANNFAGSLTNLGKGLYDLVGTFSGTFDGVSFKGSTNQIFGISRDDDGEECFRNLRGTTTITTAAVPEPSTLTFFGTGLIALAGAVRRKLAARA